MVLCFVTSGNEHWAAVNIMLVLDVFYKDTKCSFNLYLKFLTLSFLSCNFDLLEDDDIFTPG